MTIKQVSKAGAALLASTLLGWAEKPNIVFILADDMGYGSVQANNEKSPVPTPNLDRLIQEGMNFTDAHTDTSVCTPTRYGLLTGRYSWRSPLKTGVTWSWYPPLLEEHTLTVGELLQNAGYSTALIGKWHLGLDFFTKEGKTLAEDRGFPRKAYVTCGRGGRFNFGPWNKIDFTKPFRGGPIDHGFDYFFGENLPNFPPYAFFEHDQILGDTSTFVTKSEEMFGTKGPAMPDWSLEAVLPTLTEKASAYIKEQAKSDKPFFLYMPLPSPHTPIAPAEQFKGASGIPNNKYADFLFETDWSVGEVMKALEESGQAENTLLIFSTDNGTAFSDPGSRAIRDQINHQHRASKRSIYEGGHRVPYIVRWPGVTPAGSQCHELVGLNDFLATCAELTGHKLEADQGVDSHSILSLYQGKSREVVPSLIQKDFAGSYAIRQNEWKLVYPIQGKQNPTFGTELYNLKEDIMEENNLADTHPEKVAELAALFEKFVKDGRSTEGPTQPNFEDEKWFLPFK